jgi:hypothetical protein
MTSRRCWRCQGCCSFEAMGKQLYALCLKGSLDNLPLLSAKR